MEPFRSSASSFGSATPPPPQSDQAVANPRLASIMRHIQSLPPDQLTKLRATILSAPPDQRGAILQQTFAGMGNQAAADEVRAVESERVAGGGMGPAPPYREPPTYTARIGDTNPRTVPPGTGADVNPPPPATGGGSGEGAPTPGGGAGSGATSTGEGVPGQPAPGSFPPGSDWAMLQTALRGLPPAQIQQVLSKVTIPAGQGYGYDRYEQIRKALGEAGVNISSIPDRSALGSGKWVNGQWVAGANPNLGGAGDTNPPPPGSGDTNPPPPPPGGGSAGDAGAQPPPPPPPPAGGTPGAGGGGQGAMAAQREAGRRRRFGAVDSFDWGSVSPEDRGLNWNDFKAKHFAGFGTGRAAGRAFQGWQSQQKGGWGAGGGTTAVTPDAGLNTGGGAARRRNRTKRSPYGNETL